MVFDFLKRGSTDVPETKASATGPVIAYHGSGRVVWSPRDTVSLMKTGFLRQPGGIPLGQADRGGRRRAAAGASGCRTPL